MNKYGTKFPKSVLKKLRNGFEKQLKFLRISHCAQQWCILEPKKVMLVKKPILQKLSLMTSLVIRNIPSRFVSSILRSFSNRHFDFLGSFSGVEGLFCSTKSLPLKVFGCFFLWRWKLQHTICETTETCVKTDTYLVNFWSILGHTWSTFIFGSTHFDRIWFISVPFFAFCFFYPLTFRKAYYRRCSLQ